MSHHQVNILVLQIPIYSAVSYTSVRRLRSSVVGNQHEAYGWDTAGFETRLYPTLYTRIHPELLGHGGIKVVR